RLRAALEPRLERPVFVHLAAAFDPDRAEQQNADAGPRMRVPVGDAAGRKVDSVEAQQPLDLRIEVDLCAQQRVGWGVVEQLPVQARAVVDLVGDDVRRVVPLSREREDQWKYWPPSITMVWPVTKSAAGVQRKTTAPQVRTIEATLTSITRRHSSTGISVNGRIASDAYSPALLIRTSMPPCRATTSSVRRCTSSSEETSARNPSEGGFRSATATVAPSAWSPSAIARPMPCAPPVTTAILPSRRPLIAAARTLSVRGSGSAACGSAARSLVDPRHRAVLQRDPVVAAV